MSRPPSEGAREAAGREVELWSAAATGAATAASATGARGSAAAALGWSAAGELARTASEDGGVGGDADGGGAGAAGGGGRRDRGKGSGQMVCWSQPRGPGYVPIVVRYAPMSSWEQRTLYVRRDTNSDTLKYALKSELGAGPSLWRVHEGYRGEPYDRYTPVQQPPRRESSAASGSACADGSAVSGLLFIAPSFGP